jgi:RNA polymerase sigma-70 factor (ECF subfamily)
MIPTEARGAWSEIETRLRPYVARRAASPADVDDLLQEIFVRMQRGLAELRDGERFGGWVYRIAEHVIVDSIRARARDPVVGGAQITDGSSVESNDEADALQSDLDECVSRSSSPDYRRRTARPSR